MWRGERLALVVTVLLLCGVCAWAVEALLRPGSVVALGAMFTLC